MINLIIGNKGTGKTKRVIELANECIKNSKGNVVCIEKTKKLTFDISHEARLIDTDSYNIKDFGEFYGLLTGILATNYDVTDIYIDATLKIGSYEKKDLGAFESFIEKIAMLKTQDIPNFTFTVSCGENDLNSKIFNVCKKI